MRKVLPDGHPLPQSPHHHKLSKCGETKVPLDGAGTKAIYLFQGTLAVFNRSQKITFWVKGSLVKLVTSRNYNIRTKTSFTYPVLFPAKACGLGKFFFLLTENITSNHSWLRLGITLIICLYNAGGGLLSTTAPRKAPLRTWKHWLRM